MSRFLCCCCFADEDVEVCLKTHSGVGQSALFQFPFDRKPCLCTVSEGLILMNNTQDQCINAEGQFNEAEGHFFFHLVSVRKSLLNV